MIWKLAGEIAAAFFVVIGFPSLLALLGLAFGLN